MGAGCFAPQRITELTKRLLFYYIADVLQCQVFFNFILHLRTGYYSAVTVQPTHRCPNEYFSVEVRPVNRLLAVAADLRFGLAGTHRKSE